MLAVSVEILKGLIKGASAPALRASFISFFPSEEKMILLIYLLFEAFSIDNSIRDCPPNFNKPLFGTPLEFNLQGIKPNIFRNSLLIFLIHLHLRLLTLE